MREKTTKKNRSKKVVSLLVAVMMLLTMIPQSIFAEDTENTNTAAAADTPANLTTAATPKTGEEAWLKWSVSFGEGYAYSMTPPLIKEGYIYTAVGKTVKKLDIKTGETVATGGEMEGLVNYATIPMIYADGKLFVLINNGRVQAVDFDTLQPLWVTESIGGQTLTPLTYRNIDGTGYVFTGTWNGEATGGSYICFTTDGENLTVDSETGKSVKQLTWKFTPAEDDEQLAEDSYPNKGFYWAGAYVTDNYIVFGSDDGADNEEDSSTDATSVYYSLNVVTGKIIDRIYGIDGDIRSTSVYDDGYLYFSTKGGKLYRVLIDSEGNFAGENSDDVSSVSLGGESTGRLAVSGDRLYVGVKDCTLAVADISSALTDSSLIYKAELPGYAQAGALVSTAYADEDFDGDGEGDGRTYVYVTCNAEPGGIYYVCDEPGATEPVSQGDLFVPSSAMSQFCISPIVSDEEGTLYYKNDSGHIMAIEQNDAYITDLGINTDCGGATWSGDFSAGTSDYSVKINSKAEEMKLSVTIPEGVTAKISGLNPSSDEESSEDGSQDAVTADADAGEIAGTGEEKEIALDITAVLAQGGIKIETSSKNSSRNYNISVATPSTDCTLSSIKVTSSNTYGEGEQKLTESFTLAKTSYTTAVLSQRSFYNLWPDATDENATVKVTPVSGATSKLKSDMNSDGSYKVTGTTSGHDRYAIYFTDKNKNAKVRIDVTSEDGENTKTYYVTLVPQKSIAKATVTKVVNKTYTGKAQYQSPVVKMNGKTLKKGTDYTLSYSSNKAIGTATVKITGKGEYKDVYKKTFKIVPKKVTIKKLKAGKKKLTARYATVSGGVKYQIAYKKAGTSKWKYKYTSSKSLTIKKLAKGKKYYVKVRAYKKVKTKTYYGAWSAAKKVKVK